MTASHLIHSTSRAALEVRVVRDAPRIAFVWPEQPEPHEVYAAEHALAAMVEAASPEAARWDLRLVEGEDRGVTFMGVELALDVSAYALAREGELVLSRVVEEMEAAR